MLSAKRATAALVMFVGPLLLSVVWIPSAQAQDSEERPEARSITTVQVAGRAHLSTGEPMSLERLELMVIAPRTRAEIEAGKLQRFELIGATRADAAGAFDLDVRVDDIPSDLLANDGYVKCSACQPSR